MGWFPAKIKSLIDLLGGWKISGTQVTATAAELNILHGATSSTAELNTLDLDAVQTIVADGAITVKNGIVLLAKTGGGALAVTLADPAAGDNYKKLYIFNQDASASTVTAASGFGGAGADENVATFTGSKADSLVLMAYNTKWCIIGGHQVATA